MSELRATYRLQLGPGLGFEQARELVTYLRELGISHLYLSPSLQARRGSTHGYDVVDPTRVSDELGGEQGLRELAGAGLGIVLDIVPNHMAASEENPWWSDPELRRRFFDVDEQTGAYRRFFDIDDLAAIRQELPEVFETTHGKVLELLADGVIDGLRVDHPDGLADPAGYLRRLRDAGAARVWVEKILHPGEALRDWPVEGTVGYEFLVDVAALFIDPSAERSLSETLAEFTGETRGFAPIALEAQLEQAQGTFARELERLWRLAPELADRQQLAQALARLPVYRTYAEPWSGRVEPADREAVEASEAPAALRQALALQAPAPAQYVTRFQQTSPAVTAKGIEDTAFYRYPRLLALNEVGNDPGRFSLPVADFHAANAERARRFPRALLITQTHDTKRSGDARARIGALSAFPDEWRSHVTSWRAINEPLREGPGPDAQEEYLLYQTLVGVWPVEPERLEAYLRKALREAKRHTTWAEPDDAYERSVTGFARAAIAHGPFLTTFEPFAERVAHAGERSALGQLLLKLTSPGVPDIFQGDELWRLSLVDPDNRRPVDWEHRRAALAELKAGAAPTRETIKLYLTWRALELRARRPEAFAGAYAPLEAGPEVCAFVRGSDELLVLVRLRRGPGARIAAPAGDWSDVLSGARRALQGEVEVDALLGEWDLALLERA